MKNMRGKTFFVAGVYGVGKSTLCGKISSTLNIPNYSAGDLISNVNGEKYGVNKIVKDKLHNQDILSTSVQDILQSNENIILAGHFCIFDKTSAVDVLPESVFLNLSINKIILLEADINRILENLCARDNKIYFKESIALLQKAEKLQAENISQELKVPLYCHYMKFDDSDIIKTTDFLQGGK
jgi:adenylate kinase